MSDLLQQAQSKGIKSAIILSCANNNYPLKETNQLLQTSATIICGAVFPQLIFAGKIYDKGIIIIGLQQSITLNTIEYISTDSSNLDRLPLTEPLYKKPDNTMFLLLFVDGIAKGAEYFIDRIYEYFGTCCNIIGAGAGCHELTTTPCIYSNKGILQDSAQVVQIPKKMNSAIQHGWNYLAGSFLVTSATKNRVHELDYQPAYQVYKEALQSSANIDIEKNSFAKTAALFPLGMEVLDDGIIVRDPINKKDNDLICVGDIPVFSNIIILERNKKSLIKATYHSVELAKSGIKGNTNGFLLLFDCYSRKVALGKYHKTTIAAINENETNNTPYIGALSIGEIMSSKVGSLRLHSKSTLAAFIS